MTTMALPQLLPVNQFDHFYAGGDRIGALRGGPGGPMRPEEWIASTTARFGQELSGLSILADGTLLRAQVAADPLAWLGSDHVAAFGTSTELLTKLLDPAQRLPVHFHPNRAFARQHMGLDHGKTEAWVVLEAPTGARVGLGFRESMAADSVLDMVHRADSTALLASLHRRAVSTGDAIFVPAGLPHAIDAGILILELQEPTDLSLLLESEGFAVANEAEASLGMGYDTMLGALRLEPVPDPEQFIAHTDLTTSELRRLLPTPAERYFRADLVTPGNPVAAGFAVLLAIAGDGALVSSNNQLAVRRGDAVVVPHGAGDWSLRGVTAIAARPPLPIDAAGAP